MDEAAAVVFNRNPIPGFDALPHFNIRNGDPNSAMSLLIRPTIPTSFHWVRIQGLPPTKAMEYADAMIMEHFNHLSANTPAGWTAAQVRKAALALGVSRAVATKFHELSDGDFIPGETAESVLIYQEAVAAAEGVEAVPERLVVRPGTPADVAARINTRLEYSPAEAAVMTALIPASIGIVAVQGFSLINTQHHYISDAQNVSFKAFLAIERQCWKAPDVADWFSSDEVLIRDILWHKSCHPVNMTIKTRIAQDEATKKILVTAGAGAAASRIPATEPGVRAGEAYATLFNTLRPFFEMFSGGIDSSHLDLALRTVKRMLPGVVEPANTQGRDPDIPTWVTDRSTAGRWVSEIVDKNQAVAAHCFGFYCAMSEAGMTLGTGQNVDSLRSAHSLKKLATSCVPSYTLGYHQYSDYVAAKNKLRARAQFEAPIFQIPKTG